MPIIKRPRPRGPAHGHSSTLREQDIEPKEKEEKEEDNRNNNCLNIFKLFGRRRVRSVNKHKRKENTANAVEEESSVIFLPEDSEKNNRLGRTAVQDDKNICKKHTEAITEMEDTINRMSSELSRVKSFHESSTKEMEIYQRYYWKELRKSVIQAEEIDELKRESASLLATVKKQNEQIESLQRNLKHTQRHLAQIFSLTQESLQDLKNISIRHPALRTVLENTIKKLQSTISSDKTTQESCKREMEEYQRYYLEELRINNFLLNELARANYSEEESHTELHMKFEQNISASETLSISIINKYQCVKKTHRLENEDGETLMLPSSTSGSTHACMAHYPWMYENDKRQIRNRCSHLKPSEQLSLETQKKENSDIGEGLSGIGPCFKLINPEREIGGDSSYRDFETCQFGRRIPVSMQQCSVAANRKKCTSNETEDATHSYRSAASSAAAHVPEGSLVAASVAVRVVGAAIPTASFTAASAAVPAVTAGTASATIRALTAAVPGAILFRSAVRVAAAHAMPVTAATVSALTALAPGAAPFRFAILVAAANVAPVAAATVSALTALAPGAAPFRSALPVAAANAAPAAATTVIALTAVFPGAAPFRFAVLVAAANAAPAAAATVRALTAVVPGAAPFRSTLPVAAFAAATGPAGAAALASLTTATAPCIPPPPTASATAPSIAAAAHTTAAIADAALDPPDAPSAAPAASAITKRRLIPQGKYMEARKPQPYIEEAEEHDGSITEERGEKERHIICTCNEIVEKQRVKEEMIELQLTS